MNGRGPRVALLLAAVAAAGLGLLALAARERAAEAERRAAAAEAALRDAGARAEAERGADRRDRAGREARLEEAERWKSAALRKAEDLEQALGDARVRISRLETERSEARAEAEEARRALAAAGAPGADGTAPPGTDDGPAAAPPPKAPSLGAAAVTDPGQVRKLLDGLNALLALADEREAWTVASAEAADGDRLVRAVVEARAREGGLSRSFRAEEVRFVLSPAARTLEVRFRDGRVTYPGDRSVDFPDGRYSAILAVDPVAIRNAAHPLVGVSGP